MHQPVQWHEWGEEAFATAQRENKPILLDIGAVWCHWCHVMDRESYDDPEIAQIVNERFVAIKVDRDERPDIDSRYQVAVQAVSGQGGWPLTAFLTPDGKPFYGGTYFPPDDHYGRPGFKRVLLAIAGAFREKQDDVMERPCVCQKGELGALRIGEHGLHAERHAARHQIASDRVGRLRRLIRHAVGIVGRQCLRDLIRIDDVQTGRPEERLDERGFTGAVRTGDDHQDAVRRCERVSDTFRVALARTHQRVRRRATTVRTNARFSNRPRVRVPSGAMRMMAPDPFGSLS